MKKKMSNIVLINLKDKFIDLRIIMKKKKNLIYVIEGVLKRNISFTPIISILEINYVNIDDIFILV